MVEGVAPAIFEHCSFNIRGKNGLNGNFGKQLASTSRTALQQAGPMLPNFPVNMDWEISAIHPGLFIVDDQHCVISGDPGIPGLSWNGNGNGIGNCGNWAFVETMTHMTVKRRITFLITMILSSLQTWFSVEFVFWLLSNSTIVVHIYRKKLGCGIYYIEITSLDFNYEFI